MEVSFDRHSWRSEAETRNLVIKSTKPLNNLQLKKYEIPHISSIAFQKLRNDGLNCISLSNHWLVRSLSKLIGMNIAWDTGEYQIIIGFNIPLDALN